MQRPPKSLMDVLASFGLTCVILFCMYLLTLIGTVHQVTIGLHAAQLRYFDAWLVWAHLGPLSIPVFPAGQTLMAALFVNLVVGGMVRLRKSWSRAGIFITHIGIAALLLSGFVRYYFADEGQMGLLEGQRSRWFNSLFEWEIPIGQIIGDGTVEELVIPHEEIAQAVGERSRTFTSPRLPFDLVVSGFLRNCKPRPQPPHVPMRHSTRAVDGFILEGRPPEKDAERQAAGCYVAVVEKASGEIHDAILWGAEAYPFVVEVDGRAWSIGLQHRRWQLPFVIALDATRRELYPRTNTPKSFESDVRKIEDGVEEKHLISMNEPLRDKGYVLYQSQWDEIPGRGRYSVLAVARNPSDQWPLISCLIISLGLVLHFSRKLSRHVRSEARRHA
jgi:hypothetical protein